MAIDWVSVEGTIEDSVDTQATAIMTAACETLKAALDAFVAVFTGTPDADFVQVATFLSNLASATTGNAAMLSASQIKAQIPATMSAWVTAALENLIEASLPSDAQNTVQGGHTTYLPHQA